MGIEEGKEPLSGAAESSERLGDAASYAGELAFAGALQAFEGTVESENQAVPKNSADTVGEDTRFWPSPFHPYN